MLVVLQTTHGIIIDQQLQVIKYFRGMNPMTAPPNPSGEIARAGKGSFLWGTADVLLKKIHRLESLRHVEMGVPFSK
ncbi:MAG: hypothetical protein V2B18_21040 [Pseudomonadota bacterium]